MRILDSLAAESGRLGGSLLVDRRRRGSPAAASDWVRVAADLVEVIR